MRKQHVSINMYGKTDTHPQRYIGSPQTHKKTACIDKHVSINRHRPSEIHWVATDPEEEKKKHVFINKDRKFDFFKIPRSPEALRGKGEGADCMFPQRAIKAVILGCRYVSMPSFKSFFFHYWKVAWLSRG